MKRYFEPIAVSPWQRHRLTPLERLTFPILEFGLCSCGFLADTL